MLEIKGSAIANYVEYIKNTFGEDGFRKLCSVLSDDARELVEGTILSSSWYDGSVAAIELRHKACMVFFDGDVRGARLYGEYSANRSLRGVYKVFIKAGSPNWLVERSGGIFMKYFRPGKMAVIENEKGRAQLRLSGFPTESPYIEESFCGFMEAALKVAGAKTSSVVMKSVVVDGENCADFLATWN